MADEHDATGTTDAATGTTAQAADGSVAAADGSEVEQLRARLAEVETKAQEEARKNAQLLSEKSRWEDGQRELERMRFGGQQPSPGGAPDGTQQLASEIQRAAAEGDVNAQGLILMAQEQARREKYQRDLYELQSIPEADKADTQAEYQTGLYMTPTAAYSAVLGKRYRRDAETRATKDAGRKRQEDELARRRADDVVDTTARGVGAGEVAGRTIKHSEYLRQLRTLPRDKAIALRNKVDAGLMPVVED